MILILSRSSFRIFISRVPIFNLMSMFLPCSLGFFLISNYKQDFFWEPLKALSWFFKNFPCPLNYPFPHCSKSHVSPSSCHISVLTSLSVSWMKDWIASVGGWHGCDSPLSVAPGRDNHLSSWEVGSRSLTSTCTLKWSSNRQAGTPVWVKVRRFNQAIKFPSKLTPSYIFASLPLHDSI